MCHLVLKLVGSFGEVFNCSDKFILIHWGPDCRIVFAANCSLRSPVWLPREAGGKKLQMRIPYVWNKAPERKTHILMTEHGMPIIGIYCIDKKGKHLVNKGFAIFFHISYFKVILSCQKTLVHYEHSVS